MANSRTKAKIEARIHERVAYCLEFELSDPRATFITVTRVEISQDLSSAKIFYTVLGSDGARSAAAHMLEDATGFVRRQVGRVLKTRRIPLLSWFYDESVEKNAAVQAAISEAIERDRQINPGAHDELARKDEAPDEEEDFGTYDQFED